MKKLRNLLVLCMILCIVMVATACGHTHEPATDWENDATNHWHACVGCEEQLDLAAHTFDDGVVTTPATEEAEGVKTFTCTDCGFAKTEKIAKLEPATHTHSYTEGKCECGATDPNYVPPHTHNFVDGKCECGEIDPNAHKHSLTKVDEIPADCVNEGVKEYYECDCGKIFADAEAAIEIDIPEIIPTTDHTPVEFGEEREPDCTTVGMTKGSWCESCQTVLVPQKVIPANGHSFGEGEILSTSTCSVHGEEKVVCSVCNESEIHKLPFNDNIHAWNEGTITTPATCSTKGEMTIVCKYNPEHTKKEEVDIAPDAHVWDDGAVLTAPTCMAEGEQIYKCTLCDAGEKKETVAIDATAHSWNEGVITIPATCVEGGVKTFTCTHNAEHTYTEAVDALGHDIVKDEAVAPKCAETGLTEGQHCSRCDAMTILQEVIPVTGHSYDDDSDESCNTCGEIRDLSCKHNNVAALGEAKAPTCTESGITAGEQCTDCGEILVAQEFLAALGHTEVVDKAVEPTCSSVGYTEGSHCSVCNTVFTAQETLEKLSHTPEEAVKENDVAPNCTDAGSYDNVVYCSVCNEELSRNNVVVNALGHKEEIILGYAATCTTKGLSNGAKCSVCGTVIVEQTELELRPHAWNNPVITVDGAVGTVTYTCKDCDVVDQYTGPVNKDNGHVCDHLVNGVETEYGKWTACSVCGAKSYAQTAISAYKGSGATHASVDVYVLKDGKSDATKKDNLVASGTKVSDVAVTYNLTSGADKNNSYVEFTYTITATEATTVNVYFNGRSTNIKSSINQAAQINKFMKLYQGDTEISIPNSAVLPAYVEGSPYWTEQKVATVELVEGENTFTFRFTKEGGIYNGGKYYGAYASYFRFAEPSKAEENCSNNYHDLELVYGSTVSCTQDGVQMHYACTDCGKVFDYYTQVEVKYENLIIPAYDEHIYDSIPHPRTDAEGNDYFAYFCVRGCGAEQIHTCTNDGKHLIIAREPNQVWYEDGDLFNPDRMEVYLSNCAEGCGDNVLVAGHLAGYEALTYTYQNGDSFKAGDEYITISYTLDGVTYSANLPVTVTAVGKTITVDNGSENFSYTNIPGNKGDHPHNPGTRADDQGVAQGAAPGQSAYGGSYTNNFTDGDIAKFTFTLDEAGTANIVLRAATDRITGNIKYAYETIANEMMIVYIDGQAINLADSIVFNGSVANIDPTTNRWTWTVWSNIDLGTFDLGAGEHTVEILYNNISDYKSAEGYNAHVQLDCLNVFLAD